MPLLNCYRARRVLPALAWLFLAACASAQIEAASLPEAPTPHIESSDTRAFVIFSAIEYAATFSDAAVSASYIKQGGRCVETDPIFGGRYPSRRRFFLQMGIQTTGVVALNYLLMRHRQHWWSLLSAADTMLHAGGVTQTLSLCGGAHQ